MNYNRNRVFKNLFIFKLIYIFKIKHIPFVTTYRYNKLKAKEISFAELTKLIFTKYIFLTTLIQG